MDSARITWGTVKTSCQTINEYVDDFREIVDCARYFEGAHIVLKFRQGLNPKIQDHVVCLTSG